MSNTHCSTQLLSADDPRARRRARGVSLAAERLRRALRRYQRLVRSVVNELVSVLREAVA